jgi:hypothetical protein
MPHRTKSTKKDVPRSWGEWFHTSDAPDGVLYEIAFKGGYVEVQHLKSFELTSSVAEAIWDETLALCRTHDCKAVLRIGEPPVRGMDPAEVVAVSSRLDIPGLKVAYCWIDYRPDKINAIFASRALENDVRVRFFCDREGAVQWLTEAG